MASPAAVDAMRPASGDARTRVASGGPAASPTGKKRPASADAGEGGRPGSAAVRASKRQRGLSPAVPDVAPPDPNIATADDAVTAAADADAVSGKGDSGNLEEMLEDAMSEGSEGPAGEGQAEGGDGDYAAGSEEDERDDEETLDEWDEVAAMQGVDIKVRLSVIAKSRSGSNYADMTDFVPTEEKMSEIAEMVQEHAPV